MHYLFGVFNDIQSSMHSYNNKLFSVKIILQIFIDKISINFVQKTRVKTNIEFIG